MLILLRPLALSRCPPHTCTRALTTRPKTLPSFVSVWTPSLFSRIQPRKLLRKPNTPPTSPKIVAERKAERRLLRDARTILVEASTRDGDAQWRIKKLNECLQKAQRQGCDPQLRVAIWRHYIFCRDFSPSIPQDAWDILWNTQAIMSPKNPRRNIHLVQLHDDMRLAGFTTTLKQRTTYLWSVFKTGRQEQALEEWEADYGQSSPHEQRMDHKPEHLELGARMYADFGDADRAREIMNELLDLYPGRANYFLKNVFRAHTRLDSVQHHVFAYEMYRVAKSTQGKTWRLPDFDKFLVGFLEARHLPYAISVFKDMVISKQLACETTEHHINETLTRLNHIYRLGTDIKDSTVIVLAALSVLPPTYHSHVYGDWMKSATVYHAPEAAARILDLMFDRGSKPETFHFNLLLKTLFRTKRKPHEVKAEDLAWRMVDVLRKASPRTNAAASSTAEAIIQRATLPRGVKPLMDSDRTIPPANITTFALLMRLHAQRSQWEHVDYLARQLRDLEIKPNTSVMNILMDNKTRQGKYNEAWEIYKSLTDVPEDAVGVFPDGATMRCLWMTLRLSLGDHGAQETSTLPTPRALLAETVNWYALVKSRSDSERFRIGLAAASQSAITALIMHCFSYTKDLAGSLVAVHVLKKHFGIHTSGEALLIIQKHAAWTDLRGATTHMRSHFARGGSYTRNIEQMGMVYNLLMERRFARLGIDGDRFAYMGKKEVEKLELNLLSEFVRVILTRLYNDAGVVERLVDEAKMEIGVPELQTGDLTAFDVV